MPGPVEVVARDVLHHDFAGFTPQLVARCVVVFGVAINRQVVRYGLGAVDDEPGTKTAWSVRYRF